MSIVRRLFGFLGKELEKGLIPAINLYETMDEKALKESLEDFEPFVAELIKYQKTSKIVNSLIQFKVTHFNEPVLLPKSSLADLKTYTKLALSSRDMVGVDSAIHLLYTGFPERPFPFESVIST